MKAQKIFAALALAALTSCVAVGITACKPSEKDGTTTDGTAADKATFKISDYVAEENVFSSNVKGDIQVRQLLQYNEAEVDNYQSFSNIYGYTVLNKGTSEKPSYTVYNRTFEKTIVTDAESAQRFEASNPTILKAKKTNADGTQTVSYYTPDGKELLTVNDWGADGVEYADYGGTNLCTLDGEPDVKIYSLKIVRTVGGKETVTYKYFRPVYDKWTGMNTGCELLDESRIIFEQDINDVYAVSATRPVEDQIKDYKYSVAGNTFTFYKNGAETGSVTAQSGKKFTFLGDCMYYYGVNSAESGYQLYRYDIVKNENKKSDWNIYASIIEPMYNYKAKCYDAAYIYGYEKVEGESTTKAYSCIVDKDMKILYDFEGKSASVKQIKDLGNGKYSLGGLIVNENVSPLISSSESNLYVYEGLVSFYTDNCYGFKDFDGNMVIQPKYTAFNGGKIIFYNGAACVKEIQPDQSVKEALLKTDGTVTYIEDIKKTIEKDNAVCTFTGYGFYYVRTSTETGAIGELFSYGGKSLKKFTLSEGAKLTFSEWYVTEKNGDTAALYAVS